MNSVFPFFSPPSLPPPAAPTLASAYPLLVCFAGDNGEGEDGGLRAREEGDDDGESEGETVQLGRIFVKVPPAKRLGPRGLDALDHQRDGSQRPGQ